MNIIDTYSQIGTCFTNGIFNMERWEHYVNSVSVELAVKLKNDIADYDFQNDVLPHLNDVADNLDKLDIAHRSFLSLTDGLPEKIRNALQTDLDVTIMLYLGLCNGAGWATELDGKPIIMLGVEKIIELSWYGLSDMAGLMYHELGHIWHNATRKKCAFNNGSLWKLYCEGMAMFVEQRLMGDADFYHQNIDGWLDWCRINQRELSTTFLDRVINCRETNDFFGDWNRYQGKSDIGYYLGCEIVKSLSEKYSLPELAELDENEILHQLQKTAN